MTVQILPGDCREVIPTLGVMVDSVVCDPPYDLVAMTKRFGKSQAAAKSPDHQRFAKGFMGREWDGTGVAFDPETWRIIGSVLRPGGIILAFGAPRTHHRLASAIEDAGFVIQDCLMWLFATGFPKRRDMLKPAYEPVVMAYKPGGARTLQIDECRILAPDSPMHWESPRGGIWKTDSSATAALVTNDAGRWPASVCHDGSDEVVACFPESAGQLRRTGPEFGDKYSRGVYGDYGPIAEHEPRGDSGSAARFFWSSKAGAQDRWGSKHPTVKPIELMKWLVALVTPPGGIVLDPFAGSGTTGVAALATGRDCILIEREAEYQTDIRRRMALCNSGPDERRRESIKAKTKDLPQDHGPLFGLAP